MVSKTELHMNYTAITHLPIVQRTLKCVSRLTRENKELKKENDMLKKMIDTLFDRQLSGNTNCCGGCHKSTQSPISEVHIKKEKVVIDISEETENITYELRDSCNNSDKPFAYDLNSETIEKDTVSDNINCNETKIINNIVEETSNVVEVEESEEEEVEVEESEEEEEVEVEVEESEEEEEVEVEESEEEEEVEVEVEESEEEVEVEVEVEESEEEEEVEVEVEESEEEEEVEVEVEESEEEEEVEVEVEESEEEVEVEESEEDEVYEVTIKNKSYYTTNETDGPIYAILDDEDIGDQIGEFKEGKPTFYRKTKK